MNNKLAKYKIDDIIQHNEDTNLKRKIIFIFDSFYETEYSKEIYYQTVVIENNIPPTPLKESSIDKYYTLLSIKI